MRSTRILLPGLLVSILCIAATVPAPSVAFMERGDNVKVFYKGEAEQNITIAIYDEHDKRVFKETICRVNGFSKPYNFSRLPEGRYQLRVYANNKLLNSIDHVQRGKCANAAELFAKITKLKESPGKYILSIPKKGADELVLEVLSPERKLVYQKKISVNDETAMVLNLTALKGPHLLEVTSKNKTKNYFRLDNQ